MTATKTLEFTFVRAIPALPSDVFDAWLDPAVPGTPWNVADKLILDPKVDGLFYFAVKGSTAIPHYGRFLKVERPTRIQHTWMSPNTSGMESTVTVTFEQTGDDTRMTLVHAGLPNNALAKGHEHGWDYFLNIFPGQFGDGAER